MSTEHYRRRVLLLADISARLDVAGSTVRDAVSSMTDLDDDAPRPVQQAFAELKAIEDKLRDIRRRIHLYIEGTPLV